MTASGTISLTDLASGSLFDRAYEWLCHRRRDYPPNADIWSFRRRWPEEKERLRADLVAGRFRFGLQRRVRLVDGSEVDLWSPRDALVLKCLAWLLGENLPLSKRCTHLKGHGGAKAAVRAVRQRLGENHFVLKTDVRSYYASIDHELLLDRVEAHVQDRGILALIAQYLKRTSEHGGLFYDFERGISLGCSLSPIIGAFFLAELDEALERTGLFFVRYMDDVIVLAPTRWKLRRAVRLVNEVLTSLRLEKAPEKTFIGRIERGFDFLGYRLSPQGITVATATWKRFVERALRLYARPEGALRLPPVGRVRQAVVRVGGSGLGASPPAPPKAPKTPRANHCPLRTGHICIDVVFVLLISIILGLPLSVLATRAMLWLVLSGEAVQYNLPQKGLPAGEHDANLTLVAHSVPAVSV